MKAGEKKICEVLEKSLRKQKQKVKLHHSDGIVCLSIPFGIPPAAFLILISGTQNEQRFREQKSLFRCRMRKKKEEERKIAEKRMKNVFLLLNIKNQELVSYKF